MEKKLTKKDVLTKIMGVCADNEEIVNFCQHEIELLDKKNSRSGNSKTQQANEILKEKIVAELTNIGRPVTITEFQKEVAEMAEYSNQKLSALFNQLEKAKVLVKVTDKKKSFFSVAD